MPQKDGCMNDNHVFHNNHLKEEKDIQLHRLFPENLSRDTTFKPGRAKLCLQHDRISLLENVNNNWKKRYPSLKLGLRTGINTVLNKR